MPEYLEVALQMLMQASQIPVDRSDYDMIEYLNDLREGCLESYTGIIQGLKGETTSTAPPPANAPIPPQLTLVQQHVPYIVQFITIVAQDDEKTDAVIAAAAGLIGDLLTAFGSHMLSMVDVEPINDLLTQGRRSKSTKTKQLSQWATKQIRKMKNEAANPTWDPNENPDVRTYKADTSYG